MRIAIVDDIASERLRLRGCLEAQLARRMLYADIFEYENGGDFLAAARGKHFTLAFLDIYMEIENGVETARKLREFDSECLLVFVTASVDHALDGFRVRAMQYLVKPFRETEVDALLDEVVKRVPAADQYIDLHSVSGPVRLRLHEILYAEHFQHQVHIYTVSGQTIVVRQTFAEFASGLGDSRFLLCSRGSLVNLEHAEDFDGSVFLLDNGRPVPVSRSLAATARQAFADFLFQRRHS